MMTSELETPSHHPHNHPAPARTPPISVPLQLRFLLIQQTHCPVAREGSFPPHSRTKEAWKRRKSSKDLLKAEEDPRFLRFCAKTAAFLRIFKEARLLSDLHLLSGVSSGSRRRMTRFSPVLLRCSSKQVYSLWGDPPNALRCSLGSVSASGSRFSEHRLRGLTVRADWSAGARDAVRPVVCCRAVSFTWTCRSRSLRLPFWPGWLLWVCCGSERESQRMLGSH